MSGVRSPVMDAVKAALERQSEATPSREMALVKTKLQEALFWASQAENPEKEA